MVAGICLTALSGSLLYGSWDMPDGSVRLIVIWKYNVAECSWDMPDGSVWLIVIICLVWFWGISLHGPHVPDGEHTNGTIIMVAGTCWTALSGSLLYGSWDMPDGSVRLIVIWKYNVAECSWDMPDGSVRLIVIW